MKKNKLPAGMYLGIRTLNNKLMLVRVKTKTEFSEFELPTSGGHFSIPQNLKK